jgi:hypothetical protein
MYLSSHEKNGSNGNFSGCENIKLPPHVESAAVECPENPHFIASIGTNIFEFICEVSFGLAEYSEFQIRGHFMPSISTGLRP